MMFCPWLSNFLVKVYQVSIYSFLIIFIITLGQSFEYLFQYRHSVWANSKVQVLFKPQLQKAFYYFSVKEHKLHLSARVIGEYGERLSNVSVRLNHPCFEQATTQSDFDALISTWLKLKKPISTHCEENLLDSLNQIKPIFSIQSTPKTFSRYETSKVLQSNYSSKPITWSEKHTPLKAQEPKNISPIAFEIIVYKSVINSEREFVHSFKARPFKVEINLQPELYVYEENRIKLLSIVSSRAHLPKGLSFPVQNAIEVQFKLEKSETLTRSRIGKDRKFKVVRELSKTLEIDQELEVIMPIRALDNYRLTYTFKWLDLPPIKLYSQAFQFLPQFQLKDIEVIRSFWSSTLGLQGSISTLGRSPNDPELQDYFQNLIDQKKIQIKFTWQSFNLDSLNTYSDKLLKNAANNDSNPTLVDEKTIPVTQTESWIQYFSLPKNKTVQIHAQLMTLDMKSSTWLAQGESYHSEALTDANNQFAIIKLLCMYILVFFLAYTLWRFYNLKRAKQFILSVKPSKTLTVSRLSELNQPLSIQGQQASYYICDALSHQILYGTLNPISLSIFGSPRRWSTEFHNLLEQSKPLIPEGNTELIEGQLFWVTTPNYEPLLFQVPKGSGAVIIPLWPCRFALTRIWNDLFVQLKFRQSFGHGSINDLRQAIKVRGGETLLSSFDLLGQDLYDGELITSEQFMNAITVLSSELDQLSVPNKLLYPPSDYQQMPQSE